jgi:putative salt-induced outer membrane protein
MRKNRLLKIKFISTIFMLALGTFANLSAQDRLWGNSAELSFVNTSGNTEVITLSAKDRFTYRFSPNIETMVQLSAFYGETDGVKNSEKYSARMSGTYLISGRFYTSAIVGWSKDQFAGIDSRIRIGPAFGYKILTLPDHALEGEAGIEYVDEKFIDDTSKSYCNGRALMLYRFIISEKSDFSQSLEFNYDFTESDNYKANSVTDITTMLTDILSLRASYEIDYVNSPVPADLKKTDTSLSVSLIVSI